jgi:hypothetical protein
MYTVRLTQGKVAVVDDTDAPLVKRYNWHALQDGNTWYAARKDGERKILMHRQLMGVTDSAIRVDHRDRDGLNNSRANLRKATKSQNALNAVRPTGNESRYIGVRRAGLKWRARASWDGMRWDCGTYDTQEEAARAYDDFQRKYNPDFARLNFP